MVDGGPVRDDDDDRPFIRPLDSVALPGAVVVQSKKWMMGIWYCTLRERIKVLLLLCRSVVVVVRPCYVS